MKTLLVIVLVLVVVGVGGAWYLEWFTVKKDKAGHLQLNVDADKYKADKAAFTKKATETWNATKTKIANLRDKAKSHTGEDKDKLVKEIEELEKKHDDLEHKIKDIEAAGEEKVGDLKETLNKQLEEVEKKLEELQHKLEKSKDK